jgi:hydroxymethylpyrimidine kinase/phosphomethylpyrimidine kinase
MLPVALTIAGSDSGGGAGIQADLKTFQAFGVFGTSALTAVTVQNTLGVFGVHAIPPDVVRQQIDVVVSDLKPAACKTGMLATAELAGVVASAIKKNGLRNYVLDPVMVSTSGDRLLDRDAESTILKELLPLAYLITPNLDEATILTGFRVTDEKTMEEAARVLTSKGAAAALIKGGHLRGEKTIDLLFDGEKLHRWEHNRIETRNTHGTGCTVSAAIVAGLALGDTLHNAVHRALDYVHRAIQAAPGLGQGHGPLNHMVTP